MNNQDWKDLDVKCTFNAQSEENTNKNKIIRIDFFSILMDKKFKEGEKKWGGIVQS